MKPPFALFANFNRSASFLQHNLVISLTVMAVALLLGLAAGVLVSGMRRAPQQGMVAHPEHGKESIG
jgi:hypothetical protein